MASVAHAHDEVYYAQQRRVLVCRYGVPAQLSPPTHTHRRHLCPLPYLAPIRFNLTLCGHFTPCPTRIIEFAPRACIKTRAMCRVFAWQVHTVNNAALDTAFGAPELNGTATYVHSGTPRYPPPLPPCRPVVLPSRGVSCKLGPSAMLCLQTTPCSPGWHS